MITRGGELDRSGREHHNRRRKGLTARFSGDGNERRCGLSSGRRRGREVSARARGMEASYWLTARRGSRGGGGGVHDVTSVEGVRGKWIRPTHHIRGCGHEKCSSKVYADEDGTECFAPRAHISHVNEAALNLTEHSAQRDRLGVYAADDSETVVAVDGGSSSTRMQKGEVREPSEGREKRTEQNRTEQNRTEQDNRLLLRTLRSSTVRTTEHRRATDSVPRHLPSRCCQRLTFASSSRTGSAQLQHHRARRRRDEVRCDTAASRQCAG